MASQASPLSARGRPGPAILLSGLFACAGAAGAAPARAEPPQGYEWARTLSQRCDGAIDAGLWRFVEDNKDIILSQRLAANVTVQNGACELAIKHEAAGSKEWSTGGLQTRTFRQAYGYFEISMKYAGARGLDQAFWLTSDDPVSRPGRFEIDINEGDYPDMIAYTLHQTTAAGQKSAGGRLLAGVDLSRDYHAYGLLWLADDEKGARLVWYFDGRPIHEETCQACTRPAQVWATNAVVHWRRPTPALDGLSTSIREIAVYQFKNLVAK